MPEDKNRNTIQKKKNPWDAAKAVPRGTFVAIQAYLDRQEKSPTI